MVKSQKFWDLGEPPLPVWEKLPKKTVFFSDRFPKVHDLIFHLPRSAKHFKTLGAVREDSLEASHAAGNALARRFASVKNRADKLRLMLQGFEAGIKMKAGDLTTPIHTRKKRKRSLNSPGKLSEKNVPPSIEWPWRSPDSPEKLSDRDVPPLF